MISSFLFLLFRYRMSGRALLYAPCLQEVHDDHQDQDQQEEQVDHDERAAAILPGHPREFPYIADADGATGADENEA